MKESILGNKSKQFALRVIKLYKYLVEKKGEYILAKQILRSGTSIGANIVEGNYSQSNKEFIAKYNISLKEAAETEYWLELLHESKLITTNQYNNIHQDCAELIKMLISAIKNVKKYSASSCTLYPVPCTLYPVPCTEIKEKWKLPNY